MTTYNIDELFYTKMRTKANAERLERDAKRLIRELEEEDRKLQKLLEMHAGEGEFKKSVRDFETRKLEALRKYTETKLGTKLTVS